MLSKLLQAVTVMLCLSKALAECHMKGVNIAGFEFGCVTNVSSFLRVFFACDAHIYRVLASLVTVLLHFYRLGNGYYLVSESSTITPTESAKCSISSKRMV